MSVDAKNEIALPHALAKWREGQCVHAVVDVPVDAKRYVLYWLQQTLRAVDNSLIDVAVMDRS